jgi:vacuolar-type H+-ATPase subunit I/STV1|tara:strand:+ start:186 stop:605 length:420 start_codon:yes stop_codon:yes gene_type:complete
MPLSETNTDDFVTYSQSLREAKDEYTARKVQKDRHKHIHWLNTVTESREVMIEYINQENEKIRRVATRVGFENYEWEDTPLTPETINGEEVLEDQYVRLISMPERDAFVIHVDNILSWSLARDEQLNELDKKYKATMYV